MGVAGEGAGGVKTDQEATYQLSLALVASIDDNLSRTACHYRSGCGVLLRTLDEVVRAILADDLVIGEPAKVGGMSAETQERIRKVRRCKDCQAELTEANLPRPGTRICRDCIEDRISKENYRRQARWLTTSQCKELAFSSIPSRVINHWRNEWGWSDEQIRQAAFRYAQDASRRGN